MTSYYHSADLAATCNALGTVDPITHKYLCDTDENTIATVKDLIRYLRRDNESHEIRRQLGASAIVETNLIPLLKLKWQNAELFDVLLRLVGNLTSPVLLLYNEEIPTDKVVRNHFLQLLGFLQSYKEAFADDELWTGLGNKLQELLNKSWDDRSEEEGLIIERILILVRNILHIPPDPDTEKCTDNGISVHDKVIWTLRYAEITDLLMYVVSSDDEESYYIYVLEILSLYLREQNPADLANAAPQRSETEKHKDEAELLAIRHRECSKKSERIRKFTGARHSRFGGTFVVKNLQSINDNNELIYHKPLNRLDGLDFDTDKDRKKTPKNRRPIQNTNISRKTIFSIRLFLKDFCIEFLRAGYNKLMHHTAMRLERAKSVMHDESYYLWTMRFFMEFNRLYKFDIKLVSETMSQRAFHKVLQQMEHNYDMMASDKKKVDLWSKRLHLSLKAYRELFYTLSVMDKSADESVKLSSCVLKSNIFYQMEYRDAIYQFLVNYTPLKCSMEYLIDLIETQHIFLKMLEAYCRSNRSVVVQKKQKAKRKKKKQVAQPEVEEESSLEDQWDIVAPQLTVILEGGRNIPSDVVPFDASSDKPIDDQRADAMLQIQTHLREKEFETAIGLLRAAREVWPENDAFGSNSMAPEEEFMAMREIFFAKLTDDEDKIRKSSAVVSQEYEDEYEDEEGEMANDMEHLTETDFNFTDFVKRFAHPKIVQACALVLRNFDKNSTFTNHCVLKLLHRIAWDCRMHALVFQASIFRTFQRIFAEKTMPQYKELVKFATFIVRQFVKVSEKNQKVFMELLFWKNSADAYEIEEGYGCYEKSKSVKAAWTEAEEEELRMLVVEYRQKEIDADAVDWIQSNLVNNTRTRRAILKKLKELMLLTDYRPKKSGGKSVGGSRPPKEWQEEEIEELTQLFEEYREAQDPLGGILGRLSVKRPKQRVTDKLLELGLVQDKKELRKKRSSKSQGNRTGARDPWASDGELLPTASSSDDSRPRSSLSNKPQQKKKTIKKNKATRQAGQASAGQIAKSLLAVIVKEMSASLEWLHESLTEAADDMEQETDPDDSGIPLVPIAEADVEAMNNEGFQSMLINLGVCRPADAQETFWRIPSSLSVAELRRSVAIISSALYGTLTIPEDHPPTQQREHEEMATQNDEAESSDDDIFTKLRTYINKSDDETEQHTSVNNKNKQTKKKQMKNVDTEDALSVEKQTEAVIANILSEKPKTKKKRKIIEDSNSEDENFQKENKYDSDNSNKSTQKFTGRRILGKSDSESNESTENTKEEANNSLRNDSTKKNKTNTSTKIIDDSDSDFNDATAKENTKDEKNTSMNDYLTKQNKSNAPRKIIDDSDSDYNEATPKENTKDEENISASDGSTKKNKTDTIRKIIDDFDSDSNDITSTKTVATQESTESREPHSAEKNSNAERRPTDESNSETEENTLNEQENSSNKIRTSRIIEQSDSESNDTIKQKTTEQDNINDHENGYHSDDSSKKEKNNMFFSRKIIESDSESNDVPNTNENMEIENPGTSTHKDNSKRTRESDSDDHNESITKKKKLLFSDDED